MSTRILNKEERKNITFVLKLRGMHLSGGSFCANTETGKGRYNIGIEFLGATYDHDSLGRALKKVLTDAEEIFVEGIKVA